MKSLDLILLGDMHYVGPQALEATPPARRRIQGLELAARAIRDALQRGRPDAIILLGDIVDRGSTPGALAALREVNDTLRGFNIPLITVPGNHDDFPDVVQEIFQCPEGIHEVNGYLLATFSDNYADNEEPVRADRAMRAMEAATRLDHPLIAIQHAVILPEIKSEFPYNFRGHRELAAAYSRAGVCLSISGHYHAGSAPLESDGVTYLVCPLLCEHPFPYMRVRMDGRRLAAAETHALIEVGMLPACVTQPDAAVKREENGRKP